MAVPGNQLFQITGGFVPGLGFKAHQCQRVTQLVIVGVLLDQRRELDLGVIEPVLFNQRAGVCQAQTFVVRVLADAFFQQRDGFFAAVEALQQACMQQDRRNFAFFRWVVFKQGQGTLAVPILLQQQSLAEDQLAIVRVFDQQAVEAFE
ncbi:hypothetical protein D9M71_236860 [compost metagenome]